MKTANKHALAKTIRSLYLARLNEAVWDNGSRVTVYEGVAGKTEWNLGIHVDSPSQWELDAALEKAERNGFESIYIYHKGA